MIRKYISGPPLLPVLLLALVFVVSNRPVGAQQVPGITQKEVTYNNHVYLFKILGSGSGQILKDGQVVGTILPDGNGGERVLGLSTVTPPSDVLVAYGMYKAGASLAPSSPAPAALPSVTPIEPPSFRHGGDHPCI